MAAVRGGGWVQQTQDFQPGDRCLCPKVLLSYFEVSDVYDVYLCCIVHVRISLSSCTYFKHNHDVFPNPN